MLLKSVQILSLQSKLSLFDYYLGIETLTDATGTAGVNVNPFPVRLRLSRLTLPKDRYKAFLRALRMWRHLRMLKRGGRAYDKTGVEGTSPGELAVLCPACPIPSINLPPNWQSVGKGFEYVNLFYVPPFPLTHLSGISTTSSLALMRVFDLRDDRSQVM